MENNQELAVSPLNEVNAAGTTTTSEITLPSNMDLAALIAASNNLDSMKPTMSLDSAYYEFNNVGDTLNCIFLGYGETTHRAADESLITKPAVKMLSNGKLLLNSGILLVRAFKDANIKEGTPVQVKYTGEIKLGAGKGKTYALALLG